MLVFVVATCLMLTCEGTSGSGLKNIKVYPRDIHKVDRILSRKCEEMKEISQHISFHLILKPRLKDVSRS